MSSSAASPVRSGRATAAVLVLLAILAPRVRAATELLVFAAASLTEVLTAVAHDFERQSSARVVFSFAGSSALARQLEHGAPAGVFVSADVAQVERLEQAGVVAPADARELLSNALVVVVPADAATVVDAPADLAQLEHLALADPAAVPAGVYAREWLAQAGVWERVRPRVVPTLDVRAALAAVATGNADAAVVYRTDAAIEPRVRVAYTVAPAAGPPIVYVAALVHDEITPAARAFVDYLASPGARRVFERFGFVVLP